MLFIGRAIKTTLEELGVSWETFQESLEKNLKLELEQLKPTKTSLRRGPNISSSLLRMLYDDHIPKQSYGFMNKLINDYGENRVRDTITKMNESGYLAGYASSVRIAKLATWLSKDSKKKDAYKWQ